MTEAILDTKSVRRWKRYDEMRDFDTEWLAKVPSHWETRRLSTVCGFQSGKAHEPYVEDGARFVCVNSRFVSTGGATRKYCTDNLSPARKNDLLMVMSDLPNGRALAKAFFVEENDVYAVNQRVCIITPERAQHARFLYYLLDRNPTFLQYDDGLNQTHLSNAVFTKFPLLIPPLAEQRAIAAFLDRNTVWIDASIEKKKRLIALLEEKRQAVITHAITRGLKPQVPVKDSSVEWLEAAPQHWKINRLKHISPELLVGLVINPSTYVDPLGDIPFLFGSNVLPGRISLDGVRRITKESNEKISTSILRSGDLVTVRVGAPGITAVIPDELDGCNCASVLITRGDASFDSDWLCYAMNSTVGNANVGLAQYGAAQEQFNVSHAVNFLFPVPPPEEQEGIALYLKQQEGVTDKAVARIEKGIAHLQEYRTALISAAVTGQIDVREEVTLHD